MRSPIYPWLLSTFPILHLYSQNLGSVTDAPVAGSLAVSLTIITFIVLGFRYATGSLQKAAAIASLLLVFFFSYGHIVIALENQEVGDSTIAIAMTTFAAAGIGFILRRPAHARSGPGVLAANCVAAALLLLPSAQIAGYWARTLSWGDDPMASLPRPPSRPARLMDAPEHPDIYYIVADGYSSNAHLLRQYGYDNSPFTDALEELGFHVAYESKSSYGATLLSLASSLNMRYIDKKPTDLRIDPQAYLRMLIADSEVARLLLERGYSYVFILSGYLLPSRLADRNLDFDEEGVLEYRYAPIKAGGDFDDRTVISGRFYKEPFARLLVQTTLLRLFEQQLEPHLRADRPLRWRDPERFLGTLAELKTLPQNPEATFTFVHLLEPHHPVQFRRDGRLLPRATDNPTPRMFFDELQFVNRQLLDVIRTLLEESTVPPVIILQADHGSDLGRVWTADRRWPYFENLNALHVPNGRLPLDPDTSPINVFGLLLRSYFGVEYEPQEVRHFDIPGSYATPFEQVDITMGVKQHWRMLERVDGRRRGARRN